MQLSIKTRIVIVSIAMFCLAIAGLVTFQMIEARDQFTAVLGSQQKALVENAASNLDEQFVIARKGLASMALAATAEAFRDSDAGARLLAFSKMSRWWIRMAGWLRTFPRSPDGGTLT